MDKNFNIIDDEEQSEIIKQIYEITSKIGCDLKRIEMILLSNKEGSSTFW